MTDDDDIEVDIARIVATHRARKTLGYSYYDTRGGYGKRYRTTTEERQNKRHQRAHKQQETTL